MAATKKKAGRKKATRKKVSRKKTTRSKAARGKSTRKKVGRPKGSGKKRGTSLSRLATTALAAELARRERRLPALERERAALVSKLDAVEAEIAELSGSGKSPAARSGGRKAAGRPAGAGAGRKRPRNAKNLEDSLVDTLRGKTMSVTDATAAVKSRGYKTTAANFRTIVNATLLKSKKIKKVSRGQYTAK